jgi:hypothetical protein
MASYAIKAGKGGRTTVATPPAHTPFVLGSRPDSVRAPAVPRIKPVDGQRDYRKPDPIEDSPFSMTSLTGRD